MKSLNARTLWCSLICLAVLNTVGCKSSQSVNPWALRKENSQLKSALRQYQDQLAREKSRSENLDADNEQLQTMLAEEKESRRVADNDRSSLTKRAPRPTDRSPQDEDWGDEKEYGPVRGGNYAGANQARGGSTGNRGNEASANIAGAQVLREGNSVRIRVTNTTLFDPGKATLKPGASKVLDQVASNIRRNYPGQLIGIEGHTDADPIRKSNWKDNHELSYQRARAVYEYLTAKGGVPSNQFYVAAYGSNNPIASNSSSSGKAQNRRVEFVVQPDGWRASNEVGDRR